MATLLLVKSVICKIFYQIIENLALNFSSTEFISPICLPTTEYVTMQEHAQDIPYETAGWGVTEFGKSHL